jgi:hypothetical protein
MKKSLIALFVFNFTILSGYATEVKDLYLNIYCSESLSKRVPSPYTYFIRHTSDKNAKIIFFIGGQPHDQAHIMANQGLTITEGKFIYDKAGIEEFHSRRTKMDILTFSIDRMSGELEITSRYNLGGGQRIVSNSKYKCISAKDSQFDEWENAILSAKAKKAEELTSKEKELNDKIRNERKF